MKKIIFFTINGKVLADDEVDAKTILTNLMYKKFIEEFKVENLMTEVSY